MAEFSTSQSVGTFGRDAASLVLEDVVATVLNIVYHAWPHVVSGGKVGPGDEEDDITDVLRWEMDVEKLRRKPVPQLRFEREAQSDLPDKIRKHGYIDVYVIYSFEQREYLAIECKRVADSDRTLIWRYVTQGVIDRFVAGKYSLEHPLATMVGYVCDGESGEVAKQVGKSLCGYDRQKTAMSEDWLWSSEERFGKLPHLFSSKHTRSGTTSELTLLHLFVGFST